MLALGKIGGGSRQENLALGETPNMAARPARAGHYRSPSGKDARAPQHSCGTGQRKRWYVCSASGSMAYCRKAVAGINMPSYTTLLAVVRSTVGGIIWRSWCIVDTYSTVRIQVLTALISSSSQTAFRHQILSWRST